MLLDEHVQGLLEKYVKDNTIVSFGTGPMNDVFLKKLALYIENNSLNISIVPTSHTLVELCSDFGLKTASLDEIEVDLAFDFVDQADEDFNYISNETTSLIRDKMIAQEASEFVVVCEEQNFVKKMNYDLLLEVSPFAVNKTLLQAMNLGEADHAMKDGKEMLSETGNKFLKVKIDEIYDVDDIEYQAKRIPGVLETSLFVGYADRILLHGDTIKVKSRLGNE
jgi:ribose 5-phosphate isomerase A